jgi:hypothetical protein
MSFGFVATNGNNETVINDSQPLYVLKRSGTLSSFGSTNIGLSKFNATGDAAVSGREILMLSCSVGNFITFNLPLGANQNYLGQFCSNQSSLPFKVFGPRTEISAPTGYNMAVFNSAGQCVWDAASTAIRINNAGRIAGSVSNSRSYVSAAVAGSNSVYATAGSAILSFSGASSTHGYYQMSARRSNASSCVFEQRRVTFESSGGLIGDFTFTSDFSYILGVS